MQMGGAKENGGYAVLLLMGISDSSTVFATFTQSVTQWPSAGRCHDD
jgi:hypothetical protein